MTLHIPAAPARYPTVSYRGRFAPSPSGPLHFGSLIAALGSFLDARFHHGEWLVRIEDIDPPREMSGAADLILHQLEAHGLHWDRDVIYQSQRHDAYEAALTALTAGGHLYYCQCSRASIKAQGSHQRPACIAHHHREGAVRLAIATPLPTVDDRLQGRVIADGPTDDPVLKRRDGLWGYPLAVVVDDLAQGVTDIVRGADLLPATPVQCAVYAALGGTPPRYLHLPLAVCAPGHKLSKQNHAPAIEASVAPRTLTRALTFLGLPPPPSLQQAPCAEQLAWAMQHYHPANLPRAGEIAAPAD